MIPVSGLNLVNFRWKSMGLRELTYVCLGRREVPCIKIYLHRNNSVGNQDFNSCTGPRS